MIHQLWNRLMAYSLSMFPYPLEKDSFVFAKLKRAVEYAILHVEIHVVVSVPALNSIILLNLNLKEIKGVELKLVMILTLSLLCFLGFILICLLNNLCQYI